MTISRYDRDSLIRNGRAFGTAKGVSAIRSSIRAGTVNTKVEIHKEAKRLDIIAGQEYGDSSLWWVIAAASNIGWGLQVPPGTRIVIPTSIEDIAEIVS
tara:strand:- start:2897 stop:3193 length:297 start_codon:yes stop_codon:yes gene_type:complete